MKKQNFNLHTHTARCGHAAGLDEQYIQSAIEAGFHLLGFSEHIPYIEMNLPNCRMLFNQKNDYLMDINRQKKIYKNQIEIKVGYEIEFLEDHFDYIMKMRRECDYMILGQHCKYIGYEYDCYCSDEDVREYTRQIEKALTYNFITYIAHPDYFMLGRRSFSKVCEEAAHRIAKASLAYDIPLEINLNGFHYGKQMYRMDDEGTHYVEQYPYPYRAFWEIISMYGCKVLFGYDAHSPLTLLERDREQKALSILEGIPLNLVTDAVLR